MTDLFDIQTASQIVTMQRPMLLLAVVLLAAAPVMGEVSYCAVYGTNGEVFESQKSCTE